MFPLKKNLKSLVLVSFIFLLLNIVFNFNIWRDVVQNPPNNVLRIHGESAIYEYVAERVRLNILSGQNPFAETKDIMFPFGWNYSLDDISPINGFYFLFLRPFLSPHQSLMLIVVLGIFFANLTMYLFLRKLPLSWEVSFIFALVYGFTPFISYRIGGHPTYTATYIFPLLALFIYKVLYENNNKLLNSILLGLTLGMITLTNLYFAVMIFMMISILAVFIVLQKERGIIKVIKNNSRHLGIAFLAGIAFLSPWFWEVRRVLLNNAYAHELALKDYVPFSADLLNFFVPSRFNPSYRDLLVGLATRFEFLNPIFEDFAYPGIIILASYLLLFKLFKKLPRLVKLLFFESIFFLSLTLGPFLKVAGKVYNVPLPFYLIQQIPYIQLARAPGRFIVPFMFLASIVAAYVMSLILSKIKGQGKSYIFLILFVVFIFDQRYLTAPSTEIKIPVKIYQKIKDASIGPVLYLPYTIRDGIRNIGYPHGIWHPYSQLIHNQPIYSVYAGRINDDIFNYYKSNYMFSAFEELSHGKNLNRELDQEKLEKSLDFFGVKSVVLSPEMKNREATRTLLTTHGFQQIMSDSGSELFQREKSEEVEILSADFNSALDDYVLFDGWYYPEAGYRWAHGKISKAVFRIINKRPLTLVIKAEAIVRPQKVKVYLRNKLMGEISVEDGKAKDYRIDLGNNLESGLNIIVFKYAQSYNLGKLTNNESDKREVSLNVKGLKLQEN